MSIGLAIPVVNASCILLAEGLWESRSIARDSPRGLSPGTAEIRGAEGGYLRYPLVPGVRLTGLMGPCGEVVKIADRDGPVTELDRRAGAGHQA